MKNLGSRDGSTLIVAVLMALAAGCSDATEPATPELYALEAVTATVLTGTVGTAVTPAPTVKVTDTRANAIGGVPVVFQVTSGEGTLASSVVNTGADGLATGAWTLGTRAERNTVTASFAGLGTVAGNHSLRVRSSGVPDVVFTAAAAPGPVTWITHASGSNQAAPVGTALPFPLRVRVGDSFGNSVPDVPVFFTVTSGGGTLAGAQALSDADGVATSGVWILGSAAGLQQVKAQAGAYEVVLTAGACPEVSCAPSTGMLAFVSERDGNSEIYVMQADGTALVRLTNHGARDIDPAWSPDGSQIAFASDRAGRLDIYVMDADGSNVVRRTTAGEYNTSPAWSPDGRRIAFSSLRDGQYSIYVMNLDGDWANPAHVGYDRGWNAYPAWSPDGGKIAFVSDSRAYDILYDLYVMNADGAAITPLLTGPFFTADGHVFYFQPAWSPDGKKLAVVVCGYAWDNCYPDSSIAIVNADGSGIVTIAPAGGFASPSWSPDGSMLAFSAQACRDCEGSVRYVSADGTRTGLITSNGHSPAWRP